MDSQIANDPAMQATKIKTAGPMAALLDKYQDTAEARPPAEEASQPDDSTPIPHGNQSLTSLDRVYRMNYKPLHLFQGRMALAGTHAIHFQVPPHVNFPKLIGQYSAAESIEVLVIDGEQYPAFRAGDEVSVLLRSQSSTGDVNVTLNATVNQEREYYLVFRNPSRQPRSLRGSFKVTLE